MSKTLQILKHQRCLKAKDAKVAKSAKNYKENVKKKYIKIFTEADFRVFCSAFYGRRSLDQP